MSVQPSSDEVRAPADSDVTKRRRRQTDDTEPLKNMIDILLAIGQDEDDVMKRERLRTLLSRKQVAIANDVGVAIVAVIDDVCPRDACANGDCVTVAYFDSSDVTPLATKTTSFVTARHQLGFVCQCESGFGGSRCDEKVDVCTPDPCPKTRVCVSDGTQYFCECPAGTYGPDCEYYDDCDGDSCSGSSKLCP